MSQSNDPPERPEDGQNGNGRGQNGNGRGEPPENPPEDAPAENASDRAREATNSANKKVRPGPNGKNVEEARTDKENGANVTIYRG